MKMRFHRRLGPCRRTLTSSCPFSLFWLTILIPILFPASISSSTTTKTTTTTTTNVIRTISPLIFTISPAAFLPNPSVLSASTHATLHSADTFRSAPLLSRTNAFAFVGLTPGSYLFQLYARDYAFEVLRVDVGISVGGVVDIDGEAKRKGECEGKEDAAAGVVLVNGKLKVQAWQTFRGHAWDDKGDLKGEGWLAVNDSRAGGENGDASWTVTASSFSIAGIATENISSTGDGNRGAVVVDVKPMAVLNYYQARSEFSVFSVFKNPMILLALVSLVLVVGIPYLMDNMDPETKAEFQKMQAESRSSLPTQSAAANQLKDFDIASWLAGRPSGSATEVEASTKAGTSSKSGSNKKRN